MYNTPANAMPQVDTLSQVRGIVLTRLEQLQMSLREYAEQQDMLTQIQLQAAQELHQLESVLKTIDGDAHMPDLRQQVAAKAASIIGGAGPMPPGLSTYPYQNSGSGQIYGYNAEG